MSRQHAYFPFRAIKARPYFEEFRALPKEERDWQALTHLALFRTRQAFGDRNITRDDTVAQACCMAESWLAQGLQSFFHGGEVVFHLTPKLRDAFLTSDLGDACADDIRFPFPSLYVHLGADLGMTFNDGAARLEGVLLERREHQSGPSLNVFLVGELVSSPAHWGLRGLETFHFYIAGTDEETAEPAMKTPLLRAIEKHLLKEGQDPNDLKEYQDWSGFTPEEKADIQRTWAGHAKERELHQKNIQVTKDCLQLAANALLYLSQYPEDAEEQWQEGTPKGYQEKFARQDGKAREKTLSRAQAEGFTRIRKVGRLFESEFSGEPGDSPAPHLRRAHWRRQAYGPSQSLRRLVWIRAVRVLGGTVRERPYLMTEDAALPGASTKPRD